MRNRYVIKFSKTGYVKYTSHLDLLRVFKKAFKKSGIQLRYSEGFNPHPKLGFAQPLSLGYESKYELLEFETLMNQNPNYMLERLRNEMPVGIELLSSCCLDYDFKSLAGETDSCEYDIFIPYRMSDDELNKAIKDYMNQKEIIALKRMKKTKQMEPVDIKSKIRSLNGISAGEFIRLRALLDGGSHSNLSPEQVISSFIEFTKLPVERYDIEVMRTNINFVNNLQF